MSSRLLESSLGRQAPTSGSLGSPHSQTRRAISTLPKSLPPRGFAGAPFGQLLPIAGGIELDDRLLPTPGLTMSGRPEAHLRHTQAPCQGLVRTGGKSNGRDWTHLAPHPDPVQPGKKWHVFVSYRSTNRPWVLALYDILKGLGYKVFLDQFVLTAAAPLALSWERRSMPASLPFSCGQAVIGTRNGACRSSRRWKRNRTRSRASAM